MATVFRGFKYCNELVNARGGAIGEMWCMYDGGNIGVNKISVKRGDFVSWGANGWKLEPNMKLLTSLDSFDMTQLAPEFDATKTYQPNDVVVYNNELYVCTATHTGEWDASDFTSTDMTTAMAAIGDEIKVFDMLFDTDTSTYQYPDVDDVIEAVDNFETVMVRYTSPGGLIEDFRLSSYKRLTQYTFSSLDQSHNLKIVKDENQELVWTQPSRFDTALNDTSTNAPQTKVVDAAIGNLDTDIGKIGGSIAPAYSSLTFPIAEGTLCMYARRLYTCSASGGIPTSEDWTAGHWTLTKVSEIIGNVESLLAAL